MPPTGYSPPLWPNFFCNKRGKVLASLDYKVWGEGIWIGRESWPLVSSDPFCPWLYEVSSCVNGEVPTTLSIRWGLRVLSPGDEPTKNTAGFSIQMKRQVHWA